MAFSSLYQPFIQGYESPVSGKLREDGALKRYESVEDSRAWSMDRLEKSQFIHDLIRRPAAEVVATNYNEIDVKSNEELVEEIKNLTKEIKKKDVELDKIHTLFKQTSKKLEDMNEIIRVKQEFEEKWRDSELQICKLQETLSELKCNPSREMETDEAWSKIKNQSDLYESVVRERNALKAQLCKMSCVEDLLRKLKKRADEADKLEEEVFSLQRELQRFGGAGDKSSKTQVPTNCSQCQQYQNELSQLNSMFEEEIKNCNKIQAEVNFLRARVRAIDVMEAELILYKTKYEETDGKLMRLKETVVRSSLEMENLSQAEKNLKEAENQLRASEKHVGELINVIEHQDTELKERDLYIECVMQRLRHPDNHQMKQIVDLECVQKGTVQSIVRQLTPNTPKSNCRCGFAGCQCGVITSRSQMLHFGEIKTEKSSTDSANLSFEKDIVKQSLEPSPFASPTDSNQTSLKSNVILEEDENEFMLAEESVEDVKELLDTENSVEKVSSMTTKQSGSVTKLEKISEIDVNESKSDAFSKNPTISQGTTRIHSEGSLETVTPEQTTSSVSQEMTSFAAFEKNSTISEKSSSIKTPEQKLSFMTPEQSPSSIQQVSSTNLSQRVDQKPTIDRISSSQSILKIPSNQSNRKLSPTRSALSTKHSIPGASLLSKTSGSVRFTSEPSIFMIPQSRNQSMEDPASTESPGISVTNASTPSESASVPTIKTDLSTPYGEVKTFPIHESSNKFTDPLIRRSTEDPTETVPSVPSLTNVSQSPSPKVSSVQSGEQGEQRISSVESDELRDRAYKLSETQNVLLRKENDELNLQIQNLREELRKYMKETENLNQIMKEIGEQQIENGKVDLERLDLQFKLAEENDKLQENFQNNLQKLEAEMNEIRNQLNDALEDKAKLEDELNSCQNEMESLKESLKFYKEKCETVKERIEELDEMQAEWEKYQEENVNLLNRIKELENDLDEKEKLSKKLTEKLAIFQQENAHKIGPDESREILLKAIRDLKWQYDKICNDKLEMIRKYEEKLKILQVENKSLRYEVKQAESIQLYEFDVNQCGDVLTSKIAKYGLESLMRNELEELHNRVRCAMMRAKTPRTLTPNNNYSFDYYTKIADELRAKYNLDDSLPSVTTEDPDCIPVKDIECSSSKTLPSVLRRPQTVKTKRPKSSETKKLKNPRLISRK